MVPGNLTCTSAFTLSYMLSTGSCNSPRTRNCWVFTSSSSQPNQTFVFLGVADRNGAHNQPAGARASRCPGVELRARHERSAGTRAHARAPAADGEPPRSRRLDLAQREVRARRHLRTRRASRRRRRERVLRCASRLRPLRPRRGSGRHRVAGLCRAPSLHRGGAGRRRRSGRRKNAGEAPKRSQQRGPSHPVPLVRRSRTECLR